MADEGGMDVGGIYITADIKADEFFTKLTTIENRLGGLADVAVTLNAALSGQSQADIDKAVKKLAKGQASGIPVVPEFIKDSQASLQEQLKNWEFEAKIGSAVFSDEAITSLQEQIANTKFKAKIDKIKIDEEALAKSVQKALEGKTFHVTLKASGIDIDGGGEITIGRETTVVGGHGGKSKKGKVEESKPAAEKAARGSTAPSQGTTTGSTRALDAASAALDRLARLADEGFVHTATRTSLTGESRRNLGQAENEAAAAARRETGRRLTSEQHIDAAAAQRGVKVGVKEWNSLPEEVRALLVGAGAPTDRRRLIPMETITNVAMRYRKILDTTGADIGNVVRRKKWTPYGPQTEPWMGALGVPVNREAETAADLLAKQQALITTARNQIIANAPTPEMGEETLRRMRFRSVRDPRTGMGSLEFRMPGDTQLVNEANVKNEPFGRIFREGQGERWGGRKGRKPTYRGGLAPAVDQYGEPLVTFAAGGTSHEISGQPAEMFATPGGMPPRRKTITRVAKLGDLSYGRGGVDKREATLDLLESMAAQADVTVPWRMRAEDRTRPVENLVPRRKEMVGGTDQRSWRDWLRLRQEEIGGWTGLSPVEQRWADWIKNIRILDKEPTEKRAGKLTIQQALPPEIETEDEYAARPDVQAAAAAQAAYARERKEKSPARIRMREGIANIREWFGPENRSVLQAARMVRKQEAAARALTMDTGFGFTDRGGVRVVDKVGEAAAWDKSFIEKIAGTPQELDAEGNARPGAAPYKPGLLQGWDVGSRGGRKNIGVAFGTAKAFTLIQMRIEEIEQTLTKGGVNLGKFHANLKKKLGSIPGESSIGDMIGSESWWEGIGRAYGAAGSVSQPEADMIMLHGMLGDIAATMGAPSATSSRAVRGAGPGSRFDTIGMNARSPQLTGMIKTAFDRAMAAQERSQFGGWRWKNLGKEPEIGTAPGQLRLRKDETEESLQQRLVERKAKYAADVAAQAQLKAKYDKAETDAERNAIVAEGKTAGVISEPKTAGADVALRRVTREWYGRGSRLYPAGDYTAMEDPRAELRRAREKTATERAHEGIERERRLYGKGGVWREVEDVRQKQGAATREYKKLFAEQFPHPTTEQKEARSADLRQLTEEALEPDELALLDEFQGMAVSETARREYHARSRRKATSPEKVKDRWLKSQEKLTRNRAAELQTRIAAAEAAPTMEPSPDVLGGYDRQIAGRQEELLVAHSMRQLTGGYTLTQADIDEMAAGRVADRKRAQALYPEEGIGEATYKVPTGYVGPAAVRPGDVLTGLEAEKARLAPMLGKNVADVEIEKISTELSDLQRERAVYAKTGKPAAPAAYEEELRELIGTPGETVTRYRPYTAPPSLPMDVVNAPTWTRKPVGAGAAKELFTPEHEPDRGYLGQLAEERRQIKEAEAARKAAAAPAAGGELIQLPTAEAAELRNAAGPMPEIGNIPGGTGADIPGTALGGGGGGAVHVIVDNLKDLAQQLMGTTNRGALHADLKKTADTLKASEDFKTMSEEDKVKAFRAMGYSKKEAREVAGLPEEEKKAPASLKGEPRVDQIVRNILGGEYVAKIEQTDRPARQRIRRAEVQAEQASLPERAPQVAFAQVISRMFGFKTRYQEAQERERAAITEANAVSNQVDEMESLYKAREKNANQLETKLSGVEDKTTDAYKEGEAALRDYRAATDEMTPKLEKLRESEDAAATAAENATKAREKAGGGIVPFLQVGTLFVGAKAFMVLNAALGEVTKLAEDVGGRGVDQLLRFQATNDKVTKSLAQQITAFHGNTTAAMGQTAAMAGLSDVAAELIGQQITPNALAMAGSAANMRASDLWRGTMYRAEGGQKEYGGFARGLFEGTGGILGGPLFAEQMGGTPGLLERITDDLAYMSNREGVLSGEIPSNTMRPRGRRGIPGARQTGIEIPGPSIIDSAAAANFGEMQDKYISDLNSAMDRGASRMGREIEVSFVSLEDVDPLKVEELKASMESAGKSLGGAAQKEIDRLIKSGVGITGLEGQNQYDQRRLVGEGLEEVAQGRQTPTETQLLKVTQDQLKVQLAGNSLMQKFQAEAVVPAQIALERIMNPIPEAGAGVEELRAAVPTKGPNATRITGAGQSVERIDAQLSRVQALNDEVQGTFEKNQQAVLKVVAPEDIGNAKGLLRTLNDIGQEMKAITEESSRLSAGLAAAQYGNQRRIMVRELQDALALGGQRYDKEIGTLGAMQRQGVMLDRQNQALSLQAQQIGIMLSQRQINFQRAVAGFVTPGVTGEERGAAIEQARIEAEYAQKQLDIQKQQATIAQKSYKLNIKIFDETVARQIKDLRISLDLLDKTYITNITIAVNEKELVAFEKKRQLTAAQLNTIIEKGVTNQNLMLSTAASTTTAVMGSVGMFYKTLTTLTGTYLESVGNWFNDFPNGKFGGGTDGGKGSGGPARKGASGLLATVSSPTTFLAGEAGTETVAILRNPRATSATPMGGGGGMTVVINVSGNSIRDDRDIDILTDRIERKLNMKASLLGFRRPV